MIKIAPRSAPIALAALIFGLGVAACGSSANSTTKAADTTTTTKSTSRATLIACLKSHGVTLPNNGQFGPGAGGFNGTTPTGPPPTGSSGAPAGGPPSGAGAAFGGGNSKFATAIRDCGGSRAGRFAAGAPGSFQLSHTRIDAYVTCVKQHGYDLPKPNFSGKGPIFPASIQTNPKFQAASKTCRTILVPATPTTTTTTTSSSP